MDAALLLIGRRLTSEPKPSDERCRVCHCLFPPSSAGNEPCPQPQTSEHLAAIEIMKLKHILILQNKIDLVKESQAKEQYEQILAFVQGEWWVDGWVDGRVDGRLLCCGLDPPPPSLLLAGLTFLVWFLQARWLKALPSFPYRLS